ncbi:hypothetical protein Trco_004893 [Trichoderma cornu-damae]|uniref:O-methyltransferase C-terminal domain-containing protein n=1 Tax=Trichoderma cornu-damae TaxID=654480 RepID=A0A9P8QI24_9HYPO|nr:hypothetical protein Trco_004893 [Trichoderma cornu-damae]
MDSEYGSPSDMSLLADQITMNISIWEDYNKRSGKSLLSVDSDERIPRMVLDARDDLMDAAFKLLQLAAGPSKITSIALSHVRIRSTESAFAHGARGVHVLMTWESVSYDELAESANVPVSELKRKLRMVITSCIFSEREDDTVRHNAFSKAFAHDEDLMRGIPFFCDVVMPASAKMVDATIRWPDSEEDHETARNIALGHDMTFAQFLTQHDRADGYTSLMRLLGSECRRQTICLADIVEGFDWQHLEKGSLVVDFGSCLYTWALAELFPHLRFQIKGPQDKLNIMKGFVGLKNPGLMARIDFCSCDSHNDQIARGAAVYLLPEILQHMPDDEVAGLLQDVEGAMVRGSKLIIVDPIIPDMGNGSLVIERERRCRDMIMRQLRNSGHRSLEELRQLATEAEGGLEFVEATCLPGSVVTTMVFGYYC